MVETLLIGIIILMVVHIVLYIFTELIDILIFQKILLKEKKTIFYSFLAIESINLLLLLTLTLFTLFIIKSKLFSCVSSLNISYLIISIIILIAIIISYCFIFKYYVIGKSTPFQDLMVLVGDIILHIFNNLLFIVEFISIRILIKKKIEGGNSIQINNINNESESEKEETKNSNINNNIKDEELNDDNISKKEGTLFIIVEGNTDRGKNNSNDRMESQERNVLKTENNAQNIDAIIKKMNDVSNLNSGRHFLKKIRIRNPMNVKSVSNFDEVHFEMSSIFPNIKSVNLKSTENKSKKDT